MRLVNSSKAVLAKKLTALLESRKGISRLDLSRQMGVADGTLGRIKYGTGNPTIEILDQIGDFFRVPSWQLLKPEDAPDESASAALDTNLLARSLTASLRTFHELHRTPSDDQLAAATVFVYTHALKGKRMDEAADLVKKQIEKAKESAIDFTPQGAA